MKPIVASTPADMAPLPAPSHQVLSVSEEPDPGLVLPVYQDDGCGRSQDVPELQWSPPAGYSPSEDGRSRTVSRRGVEDSRRDDRAVRFDGCPGRGGRIDRIVAALAVATAATGRGSSGLYVLAAATIALKALLFPVAIDFVLRRLEAEPRFPCRDCF